LAATARQSSLLQRFDIKAIPNPIDTTSFAPISEEMRHAFRQKNGISKNAFVLLFVAVNIQEVRKGFRYFKEALEALKLKRPDIQVSLLVMGRSSTETLAALPYPSHALGMVTEQEILTAAYSAADAFVIPSLEDNLPNTVMESMACGTPVVGFQTGGIPEMVDHLKNGFIAEQGQSSDLAKGFQWIFDRTPDEYKMLRQKARTKVERHYANAVVAKQHIQLYRNLLETKGQP
jgi:glycosyltransferase involved in cell wall biosynthesis